MTGVATIAELNDQFRKHGIGNGRIEGVDYTSAVCVLIGSHTWQRRWVRYEIARAIIDNRGLVGVHLNNINHHVTRTPHPLGENPFNHLAVGQVQEAALLPPKYYLFEKQVTGWGRYLDYTDPVSLPSYLRDPLPGYVMPLGGGHRNIGSWIDTAAIAVGR
jgi:hypothetical protein